MAGARRRVARRVDRPHRQRARARRQRHAARAERIRRPASRHPGRAVGTHLDRLARPQGAGERAAHRLRRHVRDVVLPELPLSLDSAVTVPTAGGATVSSV